MATCTKGPSYQSTAGRGRCDCVADGVFLCADGTKWFETGSAASVEHIIQKQDQARAGRLPAWAPWVLGGLAVGGVAWLAFRR